MLWVNVIVTGVGLEVDSLMIRLSLLLVYSNLLEEKKT